MRTKLVWLKQRKKQWPYISQGRIIYEVQRTSKQFDGYDVPESLSIKLCT